MITLTESDGTREYQLLIDSLIRIDGENNINKIISSQYRRLAIRGSYHGIPCASRHLRENEHYL